MTSDSNGLWLLKLLERPAGAPRRNCGLSTLVFRDEWRVIEFRRLSGRLSGASLGSPVAGKEVTLSPPLGTGEVSMEPSTGRNVLRIPPASGRFRNLNGQR